MTFYFIEGTEYCVVHESDRGMRSWRAGRARKLRIRGPGPATSSCADRVAWTSPFGSCAEFAVNLGARVISTLSTAGKEAAARTAGPREVLRYDDDFPSRVRELTDGDGVPVVFDGVGASTSEAG